MAGRKPDKVVAAIAATLESANAGAVPIEGGPVVIPLDRAAALWLIPWMCEPECRVGARLLPLKAKRHKALYATWGDTRYARDILAEFAATLVGLESGTLELLSAVTADVNAVLAGDDDIDDDDATGTMSADADALTLLETATAIYFRTDFASITFGPDDIAVTPLIWNRVPDVHYKEEVSYLASIGRVDAEFQSMGYRHLGDYQHSRSDRREAYRVYGGSDNGTFAIWSIVAGSFNMQWFFHSLLDDGFWVTTATFQLPDGAPRPARSSHQAVGKVSFTDQAAAHLKHVAGHASQGVVSPSPGSMRDFLPVIDRFNAEIRR